MDGNDGQGPVPPVEQPEKSANQLVPVAGLAGGQPVATRDANGRFLTGNIGGGRRPGSRNRLTDVFISAIADDFAEHGAQVIARVRKSDPATYLKIVGSFVPRELVVQREREPNVDIEGLSSLEFIEMVETLERHRELRRMLLDAERG